MNYKSCTALSIWIPWLATIKMFDPTCVCIWHHFRLSTILLLQEFHGFSTPLFISKNCYYYYEQRRKILSFFPSCPLIKFNVLWPRFMHIFLIRKKMNKIQLKKNANLNLSKNSELKRNRHKIIKYLIRKGINSS